MKFINTKYSVDQSGHYSAGVVVGSTLYVSGQLSVNPVTKKIPEGGIIEETKQALKNLEMILIEARAKRENVAMCRIYIPNVELWDDVNAVYSEFFGSHKPARCVVPSNNLHGNCLIEIEAIVELEG